MDSIRKSLTEVPLEKFVGLSIFPLNQSFSLASNPYFTDPTIQKLHAISKQIFEYQTNKGQTKAVTDLIYVFNETK